MEIKQIYNIINDVNDEVLGKSDLLQEDLSNIVDVGEAVFNATSYDHYVKSLVDHIGRIIFVNRAYKGSVPSVLRDGWEYGCVLEKITGGDLPEAQENETWELEDGQSYDPNIFYKPSVTVKFYNKRITFEIPRSFTEKQLKSAFSSAMQMNGFLSMLYNEVEKSLTVKIDSLIMRTINNMTATTIKAEYGSNSTSGGSHVKAVNLLYLYNQTVPQTDQLTADECLRNLEFLKFASYTMGLYIPRLAKISTLFNVGAKPRFTPEDLLHVILLADFDKAVGSYLQSDTFHDEFVKLPKGEVVSYWQGSGTDYSFDTVSTISVKTANGDEVEQSGVLAVMFDHDALGVMNPERRVTTHYNAKAEFFNNYYKFDAQYFNDFNENFIVFFVA